MKSNPISSKVIVNGHLQQREVFKSFVQSLLIFLDRFARILLSGLCDILMKEFYRSNFELVGALEFEKTKIKFLKFSSIRTLLTPSGSDK